MEDNKIKSVEPVNSDKPIYPKHCPICGVETNYVYRVEESKTKDVCDYYKCTCGVVFQPEFPGIDVYDQKYIDGYYEKDKVATKSRIAHIEHAFKTYGPIIEELTYGRMMLDVGYGTPYNMDYFNKRGWLTWGIDCNKDISAGGNIYQGNFETYDFSLPISGKTLEKEIGESRIDRTFDLIWMSHAFEHLQYPLTALKKCYDLLSETGVLYISTPDIEFIHKEGVAGFPHWRKREHYIMWSESALKRELERVGFKIVVSRRNYSSRFISWYDVQIVAQKNYF